MKKDESKYKISNLKLKTFTVNVFKFKPQNRKSQKIKR